MRCNQKPYTGKLSQKQTPYFQLNQAQILDGVGGIVTEDLLATVCVGQMTLLIAAGQGGRSGTVPFAGCA